MTHGFSFAVFSALGLRTFLGELGSKNSFLILLLCVWCPWEGLRNHEDRYFHIFLVFVGAYLAQASRILVMEIAKPNAWDCGCEATSCLIFVILGVQARMQLATLDLAEQRLKLVNSRAGELPADAEAPSGYLSFPKASDMMEWNTSAFSGASITRETAATKYGATSPPMSSPRAASELRLGQVDGIFSERASDRTISAVLSFVMTLLLVFLAQAADKSTGILTEAGASLKRADETVGALVGLLIATSIVVAFGLFAERLFNDQRLLFAVSLMLFALSLVSLTQALLYLSAAQVLLPKGSSETAVSALISGLQSAFALGDPADQVQFKGHIR